jgi:hypothetical protein
MQSFNDQREAQKRHKHDVEFVEAAEDATKTLEAA